MARYELLERIGMGGMAEIFRGTAVAGGGFEKSVAIKRILPHLSSDQRFIELLIAEAKILSELHHRNIVQIYDVGLGDDGQYFLVMEFVDGTDLKRVYEHLFDGPRLPVEVALHICSEICEALEHAHLATDNTGKALGLVHRDVSPSNVLLSRSGEVKLTDFGIAKRVEEATGHGGVRGKFAYISPEQAVNQHVDARSDVYSVGILLYELVCGQRLFSGLADFDALREVRQGRVRQRAEQVSGVNPALAKIVMQALEMDPAKRFQSAGAFGSALRGYRYSLKTEIADPAAEIAALVAREGRTASEDEPTEYTRGGSTVVRINTAAEFNLTDLSGLHQLVTSYPPPRIRAEPDFDDMATANVSANEILQRLEDEPTTARPLHEDPMDTEKTVARMNPLLALLPAKARGSESRRPESIAPPRRRPTASVPPPKPPITLPPPVNVMPRLARAETPTEKDLFHAPPPMLGAQIPLHYPGYAGRPPGFLQAEAEARRRRIRLGLIAGGLALFAFLIAGHFLGDDDAANGAAVGPDAGSEEQDAGAALDGGDATTKPDAGSSENTKNTKTPDKTKRPNTNRPKTKNRTKGKNKKNTKRPIRKHR